MRERFPGRIGRSAESVVSRIGITVQTVAERFREPVQSTVDPARDYYEHLDPRGRRRLGYAGITAAAVGTGTLGVLLSDALLPGDIGGWIKIWGVVPAGPVVTWAFLEIVDVIAGRIRSRHTPSS